MGWGVIPQCTALLFKLYFTLHILGLLWATALDIRSKLNYALGSVGSPCITMPSQTLSTAATSGSSCVLMDISNNATAPSTWDAIDWMTELAREDDRWGSPFWHMTPNTPPFATTADMPNTIDTIQLLNHVNHIDKLTNNTISRLDELARTAATMMQPLTPPPAPRLLNVPLPESPTTNNDHLPNYTRWAHIHEQSLNQVNWDAYPTSNPRDPLEYEGHVAPPHYKRERHDQLHATHDNQSDCRYSPLHDISRPRARRMGGHPRTQGGMMHRHRARAMCFLQWMLQPGSCQQFDLLSRSMQLRLAQLFTMEAELGWLVDTRGLGWTMVHWKRQVIMEWDRELLIEFGVACPECDLPTRPWCLDF